MLSVILNYLYMAYILMVSVSHMWSESGTGAKHAKQLIFHNDIST